MINEVMQEASKRDKDNPSFELIEKASTIKKRYVQMQSDLLARVKDLYYKSEDNSDQDQNEANHISHDIFKVLNTN